MKQTIYRKCFFMLILLLGIAASAIIWFTGFALAADFISPVKKTTYYGPTEVPIKIKSEHFLKGYDNYCEITAYSEDRNFLMILDKELPFYSDGEEITTTLTVSEAGDYVVYCEFCHLVNGFKNHNFDTNMYWTGGSNFIYAHAATSFTIAEKPADDPEPETDPGSDSGTNTDQTASSEMTSSNSSNSSLVIGAYTYKITDGQAEITIPKSKTAAKVTIPATIKANGKSVPVTAIAPNAFKGMKKLTTVTIGKNIKKIGKNAFNGCKKLKRITIKSTKLTKKTVGANAFKGISKNAVIKCPKSKKTAYKKFLLKKGMKKSMTFK